jgi:hypothetical protein
MTNPAPESLPALIAQSRVRVPIALNEEQLRAAKQWAADDRLWTDQQTVEFNLRVFARVILAATL